MKLVWPVANHWRIQRSDLGGSKSFIGADLTYPHFSLSPRIWATSFSNSRVSIFFILSFYFYILCCPVTGSLMSTLPSFPLERYLLHIGIEVPILMHMRMVSLLLCCRGKLLRFEIIEL